MTNNDSLEEVTETLKQDTKDLAHEHFKEVVDEKTITQVVAAVFEGVFNAFKSILLK